MDALTSPGEAASIHDRYEAAQEVKVEHSADYLYFH
jgi:hypothetical protein